MPPAVTGRVFNLQRFSIHDGPGIRTTVFLKGCPLRCFWCHNPEGLRARVEIQFNPAACLGCGECARVCVHGAQEVGPAGRVFHRDRCVSCGACTRVCDAEALRLTGQTLTVGEVMAEVLRDQAFYRSSGGGVTLSGGEPLLQPAFARALLAACQAAGVHTAVETTLHTRWPQLAALLPLVDLFMVDIKHLDPERHRAATGVDNRLILSNLKRLAATGKPIICRIPVVPTVNATPEEVGAIARYVRGLREARDDGGAGLALELLPFHRLASDKYTCLGLEYRAAGLAAPSKADMAALGAVAAEAGVTVRIR